MYFTRTAAEPVLAGRRVIMVDFLGFGISDRPAGFGYTFEDHADSIARGLEALGVSGADVVAHSMGGSIGIVLAYRRPDLVGRLVLVEPNLNPSPRPLVEPFTEEEYVARGFQEELAAVGPQWAATMRLADPVAMYRSELALGPAMAPLHDALLALTVPRAIVEGELSGRLRHDPAIRSAGIRVHIVSGTGHVMMLDNPIGFAHAVADSLDELTS